MGQEKLVHHLGAPVTRLLLSPSVRKTALGRALYARLYTIGKVLAERREMRFLREQVKPGMVVFDVGANIGFYTFLLADAVGPQGKVHAFEPDPVSFGILEHRAARHKNVFVTRAAAGDRAGTVSLFCSPTNRADNRIHPSHEARPAETFEVPLITLDAYCTENGIEKIDAIKMDIQGAEIAALRGFASTLARLRPAWLLVEFSPEHLRGAGSTPEDFWKTLSDLGFTPWGFDQDGHPFRIEDTAAFTREHETTYTDVWARRS
ncbi:MAG TPA: FkbM family methyltransferase [Thermoanaerobaculia bacterium]|nr:FkbM family methyltransferase [Thermoanaerobaculia bacterium]